MLKRQPLSYKILQWYNKTSLLYTAVIKATVIHNIKYMGQTFSFSPCICCCSDDTNSLSCRRCPASSRISQWREFITKPSSIFPENANSYLSFYSPSCYICIWEHAYTSSYNLIPEKKPLFNPSGFMWTLTVIHHITSELLVWISV